MNNTLGDRIKYLRKSKGLTQTELGNKFGVTKTAVSNWEKNLREPKIDTIEKLSNVLNVNLEYLIKGGEKSMTLGERIREKRKAKGLTIRDMGEVLNLSYSIVAKYERNEVPITTIMLEKLAKILGTSTEYLLKGNTYTQDMNLATRIKELRKKKNLSQEKLGELIGVNIQNVYRYEKGMITDLPISRIEKLAEALDTTVDYLLNGTEIIEPEPYVENLGVEIVPKIETVNEIDYVSSRTIAEQLGKEHKHILREVDNIIGGRSKSGQTYSTFFVESSYIDKQNKQEYREYLLTRDGFTLYMFNIQGYNDFKIAYIQKFNEMEQLLLNRTRDDLYKLKFMSFKLDLLYKILSGASTPKDFDDWKEFIFNNDMNEELLACEVKNRERFNARGNKIKTITLEFETMDDPVLTRIPVL